MTVPEVGSGENPSESIREETEVEVAPPMFNPKTIACMLVGAVIGGAIGYFSVELINSAGSNSLINPENFTFVKILATTLGVIMGGVAAGAGAQEPRGNRT